MTPTVLDELLCARRHAERALARLTAETEYLREELVNHLLRIDELLSKMDRDAAWRRDRDFLQADSPAEGVLEWLGGPDGK